MKEPRRVKIISPDGNVFTTKVTSEATGEDLMTVSDIDINMNARRGDIEARITVLLPTLDITAHALFEVYGLKLRGRGAIRDMIRGILRQRSTDAVVEDDLYEIMKLLDDSVMFGLDE